MVAKLLGPIDMALDVAETFHRNYKIRWLVETDNVLDGPTNAYVCPGLPAIGSSWIFGNDNDPDAICWPNWTVTQFNASGSEPTNLWIVEQPFSTRFDMRNLSKDDAQSPFSAPPQVSGSFVKFQREMRFDYQGKPIQSMSWEPLRGKTVEFDDNRPTVTIEMNYAQLGLNVFTFMIDHVNDSPMWGLDRRMVKLSNVKWTRYVYRYGYYYSRSYDFDVDFKTFDRLVPEEGMKKLKENGNRFRYSNWEVRRDEDGQILTKPFFYDKDGKDWDLVDETKIAKKLIQYYPETNFMQLGIPGSF